MFYLYIIRNNFNKLYIGITNQIETRLKRHNYGDDAKFTKDNKENFQLVYSETYETLTKARSREQQLKKWSRSKKEALINGNFSVLKKLSRSKGNKKDA